MKKMIIIGEKLRELAIGMMNAGFRVEYLKDVKENAREACKNLIICSSEIAEKVRSVFRNNKMICYCDQPDDYQTLYLSELGVDYFVSPTDNHRALFSFFNEIL